MPKYEQQVLDSDLHYDKMMKEIESIDPNFLHSVVPGSRLYEIINTPVTEGIDEG